MTNLTIFNDLKPIPAFTNEDLDTVPILYKGGFDVSFIRLDGKEFAQVEDGIKTIIGKMVHGVIVGSAAISKRYFNEPYTGKPTPPKCASTNGMTPDKNIANPECATCADCPRNEWGSKIGFSGKPAKECDDYMRLAFCVTDEVNHATKIYRLDVPKMSLKSIGAYNKELSMHRVPINAVITRVSFDKDAQSPVLVFDAIKVLAPASEEFLKYKAMATSDDVKSILEMEAATPIEKEAKSSEPQKLKEEVAAPVPQKEVTPEADSVVEIDGVDDFASELDAIIAED